MCESYPPGASPAWRGLVPSAHHGRPCSLSHAVAREPPQIGFHRVTVADARIVRFTIVRRRRHARLHRQDAPNHSVGVDERDVEISGAPQLSAEGAVVSFLATVNDIYRAQAGRQVGVEGGAPRPSDRPAEQAGV